MNAYRNRRLRRRRLARLVESLQPGRLGRQNPGNPVGRAVVRIRLVAQARAQPSLAPRSPTGTQASRRQWLPPRPRKREVRVAKEACWMCRPTWFVSCLSDRMSGRKSHRLPCRRSRLPGTAAIPAARGTLPVQQTLSPRMEDSPPCGPSRPMLNAAYPRRESRSIGCISRFPAPPRKRAAYASRRGCWDGTRDHLPGWPESRQNR